jgi:acylpyruvate hydrolase
MIRNIWAVGRNYGDHAKELGNAVPSSDAAPMIFLKAGSSIVMNGQSIELPSFSKDIHHECEVAFRFGDDLNLTEMTIALDLTARDVQNRLKADGHPWTLAKSFKNACAIGPLVPVPKGLDLNSIRFHLKVNGSLRQSGATSEMIHGLEKLRAYVMDRFPVVPGDLLLTGTPKGVAEIKSGDKIEAEIEGIVKANWTVR